MSHCNTISFRQHIVYLATLATIAKNPVKPRGNPVKASRKYIKFIILTGALRAPKTGVCTPKP